MLRTRAVAVVFVLGGLVAAAGLAYLNSAMGTRISQTDRGVRLEQDDCDASLVRTKDRRGLYLEANCEDGQLLWSRLAADKRLTRRVFDGVDRLYLGDVSLLNGFFDSCDLLKRLAGDDGWTYDIDSEGAAVVLARVLPRTELNQTVRATLRGAGRSVRSASLEMVRFATDAMSVQCPATLQKVPGRARVDLMLGEAATGASSE
jgi:hypothetical protein